jgi:hypothetical protein
MPSKRLSFMYNFSEVEVSQAILRAGSPAGRGGGRASRLPARRLRQNANLFLRKPLVKKYARII